MSHAAAARLTARNRSGGLSAAGLHTDLMRALQAAGWPVEHESFAENTEYRGYAGPARLLVGRADQAAESRSDACDPDDETRLDLSRPPMVDMAAPLTPTTYEAYSQISGDRPIRDVIAELDRMITDARAHAMAMATNRARCVVCDDAYPQAHLLAAAGDEELLLCPVCAFDGDVLVTSGHATAYLTYQIDQLTATDLATPAGWAGVVALLACAAPPGFDDWLHEQWRHAGTFLSPADYWSHPKQLWVWLPPGDRPAPLHRFGTGARLGALVDALDERWPDLRQRARDTAADNWREAGWSDDEPVPGLFLDQIWPAAVAYAISLRTQATERSAHRPPLQHLFGSFDSLHEHLALIESPLDFDDIESALGVGIETVLDALWPDPAQPPQSAPAQPTATE
ncbi:hypothetical protein [Micromonospora tarensis]|uniref:TniQ protein n=1 Tax=Micromonospora tarensis TaxID=2806100 RepID=A0ABS1YHX1_9ACTN|nr:hypothetical protein [Micromonospora tarensis]MBM0277014.1 hypothetical protein [Micromonospora tarensis]